MTTATQILCRAADLMEERGKQYDAKEGERSMDKTVAAFNTLTGHSLSAADGFLLLTVLKIVRDQQRQQAHQDSCEDLVAYASLYAETRLNETEKD